MTLSLREPVLACPQGQSGKNHVSRYPASPASWPRWIAWLAAPVVVIYRLPMRPNKEGSKRVDKQAIDVCRIAMKTVKA